jgi:hypothetical protein
MIKGQNKRVETEITQKNPTPDMVNAAIRRVKNWALQQDTEGSMFKSLACITLSKDDDASVAQPIQSSATYPHHVVYI